VVSRLSLFSPLWAVFCRGLFLLSSEGHHPFRAGILSQNQSFRNFLDEKSEMTLKLTEFWNHLVQKGAKDIRMDIYKICRRTLSANFS
jgi:hypothetical protein